MTKSVRKFMCAISISDTQIIIGGLYGDFSARISPQITINLFNLSHSKTVKHRSKANQNKLCRLCSSACFIAPLELCSEAFPPVSYLDVSLLLLTHTAMTCRDFPFYLKLRHLHSAVACHLVKLLTKSEASCREAQPCLSHGLDRPPFASG